jgi:hypothetical protein
MLRVDSREYKVYDALHVPKKEAGSNLWNYLESGLLSKIKTHKKLPWYGAEMQVTLSRILKY